jgi:hypothetical protein
LAHWSASVVLHVVQAPPPPPQNDSDCVSQVLPLQHPVEHVCVHPSQTLLTHDVPLAQVAHVLPPDPHAPGWLPGRQTLFLQQPPGQLVALQTH